MTMDALARAVLLGGALLCAAPAAAETETRPVGSFDAIVFAGAGTLEIAVGAAETVTLDGESDALRRTVTEIRGKTLYIGQEGTPRQSDHRGDNRITARISLPRLAALTLNGSGDASIAGLAGDATEATIRGSGGLRAHGRLDKATLRIQGSGGVDFSDVAADDAVVSIHGSGDVVLQARQSLAVDIHGSGAVRYIGDPPRVTTETHGSGKVARR